MFPGPTVIASYVASIPEPKPGDHGYTYRDYTTDEILDDSEDTLTHLGSAQVLALDLETTGLDPRSDEVVLVTLATPDTAAIFSPAHVDVFRPFLEDWDKTILVHYAPFDLGFLHAKFGIRVPPARVYDTRLAEKAIQAPLGAAGGSASLGPTVKRRVGVELDKSLQTSFVGRKPGDPVSPAQLRYAAEDALALFPVALSQLLYTTEVGRQHKPIEAMYDYVDGKLATRPDSR